MFNGLKLGFANFAELLKKLGITVKTRTKTILFIAIGALVLVIGCLLVSTTFILALVVLALVALLILIGFVILLIVIIFPWTGKLITNFIKDLNDARK